MLKTICWFLLSFSIIGLGGCSTLPEMPSFLGGNSDSEASSPDSSHPEASVQASSHSEAPSQYGSGFGASPPSSQSSSIMSLVGNSLRIVPAPLRVAGINTALGVLGTGFKAGLLEDDQDTVIITGKVKGLPVDLFFNLSGGETVNEFLTLRLADIDIPLSKAGVTPALESTLVRKLQNQGVDEQTAGSILSVLRPVVSVLKNSLQN